MTETCCLKISAMLHILLYKVLGNPPKVYLAKDRLFLGKTLIASGKSNMEPQQKQGFGLVDN